MVQSEASKDPRDITQLFGHQHVVIEELQKDPQDLLFGSMTRSDDSVVDQQGDVLSQNHKIAIPSSNQTNDESEQTRANMPQSRSGELFPFNSPTGGMNPLLRKIDRIRSKHAFRKRIR